MLKKVTFYFPAKYTSILPYKSKMPTTASLTSVHDAFAVHMLQRTAHLSEILPDGPFGYEPFLGAEVSDHAVKVAGVGHLQHNVQLVILNERGQVLDDVRVVQLLKSNREQYARQSGTGIEQCA